MEYFRVFLCKPVIAGESGTDPAEDSGSIFCYKLNREEAGKFDPAPLGYFTLPPVPVQVLEKGVYFFVQTGKEDLSEEELLKAAIDLQKEGLWNRLKLADRLYVRRFVEDNSPVLQLWRPVTV